MKAFLIVAASFYGLNSLSLVGHAIHKDYIDGSDAFGLLIAASMCVWALFLLFGA
jgi:hypothetical protein